MAITFKVATVTYTGLLKAKIKQSIVNYARSFEVDMHDPTFAKRDAISNSDDVELIINSDTFNFRLDRKKPTKNKLLKLKGRDYYSRFGERLATKTYTTESASAIILDLISTYYSGEFTTTGVQTTTTPRPRVYKGVKISEIIEELNKVEGFVFKVDSSKDIIFQPENYIDSGKHLNSEILHHEFEERSDDLINTVLVVYGSSLDQAVRRKIDPSITAHNMREERIQRSNITTEAEAIEFGDTYLFQKAYPVTPTKVIVKLDETIDTGEIIWLTIDSANFTDQSFVVLEIEHDLAPPKTTMKVGLLHTKTEDVLAAIISEMRKINVAREAAALTIATAVDAIEEIFCEIYCTVERRTIAGALVGEFTVGQKRAGQVSGGWTSIFADKQAILTNKGIEVFLRNISRIVTIPNKLDSANTHGLIGTSSTTAKITDTAMGAETSRLQADAGTPKHPSPDVAGELEWIFTFGDAELLVATLREFGIINNSSGGDFISRYVYTSNISKAVDEEVRVTFNMKLLKDTGEYGNITDAGLNLLRDIIGGLITDYLDLSNTNIEIAGSVTYREAVSEIDFINELYEEILSKIRVANPGEVATGSSFTSLKLYNKSSGGVNVINTTIDSIDAVVSEDLIFRQKLKIKR